MGHKPSAPKYNVQPAYTDYTVQTPYTEYTVASPRSIETPEAMQVPVYDMNVAQAGQSNINRITGQQMYSNVNSPLGGYSVDVDPVTGQLTINKQLSDNSNRALDIQTNALNSYIADPQAAATDYYNRQMEYVNPTFEKQKADLQESLANRGIQIGSNAWNSAMNSLENAQDRANLALVNDALFNGQQYQSNILGQAGMAGNQVIDPSLVKGQAGTGYSDSYDDYYNSLVNQANADYENAVLRYQNMYQDEQNRYQNDLNRYNNDYNNTMAAYQNAINAYNNDVQNATNRYNNDLNRYQGAVDTYKTKLASYNALQSAIYNPLGSMAGSLLGSVFAGKNGQQQAQTNYLGASGNTINN